MAYTRAAGHTFSIHLWDAAGANITTGTATAEISKDGAAYAAITNPTHVDDELWTVTLTDAQSTCNRYDVKVYHASLRGGVLGYSDQAATAHGVNVTQVRGVEAELDTGSGAYTVTITVNDGTDPLVAARVRVTKGAETYVTSTNTGGVATFYLNDGTWTVAITLMGYAYAFVGTGDDLVVNGAETATYSMTAITVPASDPGFVTGYFYCYDDDGEIAEGATIQVRAKSKTGYGTSLRTGERSATSDVNGLVTLTNLVPGAVYQVRRGTEGAWTDVTVASTATSPYALPNVHGED